jgi:DNA polymerase
MVGSVRGDHHLDADTVPTVCDYLRQQAEFGVYAAPRLGRRSVPAAAEAGTRPQEASWALAGDLQTFSAMIADCRACRLCKGRAHVVFGEGPETAGVMFVGEAPGADEDREGRPFVGAAGELLNRMISSIKLSREDVYIANVIKCRPPNNRDPQPDELGACLPYLRRQIALVRPKVVCALGRFAAQSLLSSAEPIGALRGQVYDVSGVKVVPTYHPAALLRNKPWRYPAFEDLKRVRLAYDGFQV